ncbi:MAG: MATE family efflux transporter [Clostridia bacterium]|nr:MATE family efflux transporter [Clostridia bacterium]
MRSAAYMCEGPLLSKIIRYSVPVILTGVLQLLFNAADLIVVGRCCGSLSVAAVGATGSLINLIVNLFIGLSVGAGVAVAQGIGAGNREGVKNAVHTAVPTAFVSGAVLTAIGVPCARQFLTWMGTQPDVIDKSTVYMRIYFCGMIASMLYNFGASILRASGDIKSPLLFLSLAGVVNVLLNLLFVIAFHMDVAGVALATVLSQCLSAALVLLALSKREDDCRLRFRKIRIDPAALKEMLRIGVPAGVQASLFSVSNVIIQSSINAFGSVAMSGNAAAGNIEGFVYVAMNAFHQTAINFTGQNFGAKKYRRIDRIVVFCLICVAGVGIVLGAGGYLAARPLLSVYITDSAAAIEFGVVRMSLICLPYFVCGMQDVMTGVLRGMGQSMAPMVICIVGVCVFRIVWIFTVFSIPRYHTLRVLYLSYLISWTLTLSVEMAVYLLLSRKYKKRAEKEKE